MNKLIVIVAFPYQGDENIAAYTRDGRKTEPTSCVDFLAALVNLNTADNSQIKCVLKAAVAQHG